MAKENSKTPRQNPSEGSSLALGLSSHKKITESPDQLGMGRNEANGKPKGPDKSGAAEGHKFG